MAKGPGRPRRTLRRGNGGTSREPVDEWAQPSPGDSRQVARLCEASVSVRSIAVRAVANGVSRPSGWCRLTWRAFRCTPKRSGGRRPPGGAQWGEAKRSPERSEGCQLQRPVGRRRAAVVESDVIVEARRYRRHGENSRASGRPNEPLNARHVGRPRAPLGAAAVQRFGHQRHECASEAWRTECPLHALVRRGECAIADSRYGVSE